MAEITRAVAISSFTIAIIAIARLLIVSNYQTPVAIALTASNGAVNTLTGTLVPLVPLLLPFATQLLALSTLGAILFDPKIQHLLFVSTTISFIATIFVAPAKISIKDISLSSETVRNFEASTLVFCFLSVIVVIFLVNLFKPHLRVVEQMTGAATVFMFAVITAAAPTVIIYSVPSPSKVRHIPDVLRQVWLPAERIDINGGLERVGYILKSDGGWTTILWDSDRSILMVKSENIINRTLCRTGQPDRPPLFSVQSTAAPRIGPCEFTVAGPLRLPPPRVRLP